MASILIHPQTFYLTTFILGLLMDTIGCCHGNLRWFPIETIPTFASLSHLTPSNTKIHGVISINTTRASHIVDPRFLSVAIESVLIRDGWKEFDFKSLKLKNLAIALSPAMWRIGGTDADFLIFNETESRKTDEVTIPDNPQYNRASFIMTAYDWDNINNFAEDVGWEVLFDFNVFLRNGSVWDSTNAQTLLDYTTKKGYRIAGWELGNEPDQIQEFFHVNITAQQLGSDFIRLRKLLDAHGYQASLLVGPDVTNPSPPSGNATTILRRFLRFCGNSTYATAWHSYSMNSKTATLDKFTDPQVMDWLKEEIDQVQKLIQKYRPYLPKSWIGETAGAYGGGVPGISDAYAGGFLWLDKLGLSAANGVDLVIRQTFYGGNYGLLDEELNPTPVYWLSALYKQLVGPVVLNVSISVQDGSEDVADHTPTHVRAYAHCTNNQTRSRPGTLHSRGSVTLFILNLQKENHVSLTLKGALSHQKVHQYLLTPHGNKNLTSKEVNLNGKKLMLTENDGIPVMKGEELPQDTPITLPPLTYGFYVIHANASTCQKYQK